MKKFIIKWLTKFLTNSLGGEVKLTKMSERVEREILSEMAHIERIVDYWELQKQAGYQMYGNTKDERYLGMVDVANTMMTLMIQFTKEPEEETSSEGYQSTVE